MKVVLVLVIVAGAVCAAEGGLLGKVLDNTLRRLPPFRRAKPTEPVPTETEASLETTTDPSDPKTRVIVSAPKKSCQTGYRRDDKGNCKPEVRHRPLEGLTD